MNRHVRRLLAVTALSGAVVLSAPVWAVAQPGPNPPGSPTPPPTSPPRGFQWIKNVQITAFYGYPPPNSPCCGIHATFDVSLAVDQALLQARKVTNGQPGPWYSEWELAPGPQTSFEVSMTALFSGSYEVRISVPHPAGGWVTYTKPGLVLVQIGGWPGE